MNVHLYIESEDLHKLATLVKNGRIESTKEEYTNALSYSKTPKAFKNFRYALEVSLNVDEFIRLDNAGFIREVELLIN